VKPKWRSRLSLWIRFLSRGVRAKEAASEAAEGSINVNHGSRRCAIFRDGAGTRGVGVVTPPASLFATDVFLKRKKSYNASIIDQVRKSRCRDQWRLTNRATIHGELVVQR
jgi:hypothetical protein